MDNTSFNLQAAMDRLKSLFFHNQLNIIKKSQTTMNRMDNRAQIMSFQYHIFHRLNIRPAHMDKENQHLDIMVTIYLNMF